MTPIWRTRLRSWNACRIKPGSTSHAPPRWANALPALGKVPGRGCHRRGLSSCSKMNFKFVHAADLHLDSPLRARTAGPLQRIFEDATFAALRRIVDLCLAEKAE